AGAALDHVVLDLVVAQGEVAGDQVDAAALGVAAGVTVAAGPAGGVPRGPRPAGGPTGPGGPAGRVVVHRHVGQGHVAAVDEQTAAERRVAADDAAVRRATPGDGQVLDHHREARAGSHNLEDPVGRPARDDGTGFTLPDDRE